MQFIPSRKFASQKHYISLNSKNKRYSSLTYVRAPISLQRKRKCLISQFDSILLHLLFNYLTIVDLAKLQEIFKQCHKTREAAKTVIVYMLHIERRMSLREHKQFIAFHVFKHRKLNMWSGANILNGRSARQTILMDVQRTYSLYHSRQHLDTMRIYLKRVLLQLFREENRFRYVQGFHYVVKIMFESGLNEQQAVLFSTYLLKEKQVERLYVNGMERIYQMCYVLDVYVYNNLPKVYDYFNKHEITAVLYAIGWFATLFAQHLPVHMVNKLWNVFILKGWKIMIKFGVAVLCAFQNQITSSPPDEIHCCLKSLLLNLSMQKQCLIWQLVSSIKVTNSMVQYLSKEMRNLHNDKQISLLQLKQRKDKDDRICQEIESFQSYHSAHFNIAICCQKVQPNSTFPYCSDY